MCGSVARARPATTVRPNTSAQPATTVPQRIDGRARHIPRSTSRAPRVERHTALGRLTTVGRHTTGRRPDRGRHSRGPGPGRGRLARARDPRGGPGPLAGHCPGGGRRRPARVEPPAAHAVAGPDLLGLPDPGRVPPGGRPRGDPQLRGGPSEGHAVPAVAVRPAVAAVQTGGGGSGPLDGRRDGPVPFGRGVRDDPHPGQVGSLAPVVPGGVRGADDGDPARRPAQPPVAAGRRPSRGPSPFRPRRPAEPRLGEPGGGLAGAVHPGRGLDPRRTGQPPGGLDPARRGTAATAALVALAHYPASMVGVPGAAISNFNPPTLAAVTFGLAQCGLALLLRDRLRRTMRRPWPGRRWPS